MRLIYVYRKPESNSAHEWAEVVNGIPVHPGDMEKRVKSLFEQSKDFATVSELILTIIGALIRIKELSLPIRVVYVNEDGSLDPQSPFDTNGDLSRQGREEGAANIFECGFYYRYHRRFE